MAIVALMSNFAKITSWWKDIDWQRLRRLCAGRHSGRLLGRAVLLMLPARLIDGARPVLPRHGAGRRWLGRHNIKFNSWHLAIAGAVIGFLTGIVVSTGPLSVPAFAAYGLVRGAFIATEAAGSLALYISKA